MGRFVVRRWRRRGVSCRALGWVGMVTGEAGVEVEAEAGGHARLFWLAWTIMTTTTDRD